MQGGAGIASQHVLAVAERQRPVVPHQPAAVPLEAAAGRSGASLTAPLKA